MFLSRLDFVLSLSLMKLESTLSFVQRFTYVTRDHDSKIEVQKAAKNVEDLEIKSADPNHRISNVIVVP